MKKLLSSCTAVALGGIMTLASVLPADAVPRLQQPVSTSSDVQTVQSNDRERIIRNRNANRNRNADRNRSHNRSRVVIRPGSVRYKTWRGHRGYSVYRPGYRRYNGFWYPPAAFSIQVGPRISRGNAHIRWCRNRYVSYRAADNTFQPYNGPRRQCVSPR